MAFQRRRKPALGGVAIGDQQADFGKDGGFKRSSADSSLDRNRDIGLDPLAIAVHLDLKGQPDAAVAGGKTAPGDQFCVTVAILALSEDFPLW